VVEIAPGQFLGIFPIISFIRDEVAEVRLEDRYNEPKSVKPYSYLAVVSFSCKGHLGYLSGFKYTFCFQEGANVNKSCSPNIENNLTANESIIPFTEYCPHNPGYRTIFEVFISARLFIGLFYLN
jgi:hypothetical protein